MPKAIYSQNLSSLAYCKRAQFQIEEIESGSNSPGLTYMLLLQEIMKVDPKL